MFKDFLGNPIMIGTWLVYPGAGNRKAEYGLLLSRVIDISDKIKAERLDPEYHSNTIKVKKFTIRNINKYVVVTPPVDVQNLFNNAVNQTLSQSDIGMVGKWVHGAKHQRVFSEMS